MCARNALHRWDRALAAYRRAEARVAAFKAQEALLPGARRAFPCDDLEEEFGRLDSLRLAALRRLLRLPAPDLAALSLKLDLAIANSAWELDGFETCLADIQADARRLAGGVDQVCGTCGGSDGGSGRRPQASRSALERLSPCPGSDLD